MSKILVKIHSSYREVIAVCDAELLGKKFEQGDLQLDVNENFYGGDELKEDKLLTFLQEKAEENATFNFVGKETIEIAIKAGIISKDGILKISNVPYAMGLV